MAAGLSRASKQENVSTTLSAGITDVATSMDVSDATKLNYPCYLVIDRVDSSGTLKSTSLWEYVKVTNIVGSTLTITRAQGGSTQQSHSSGAVVEAVMTATLMEEYYAALNTEHTATGTHVISTATIGYSENARLAVTSQASIANLYTDNLSIKNLALTSIASIASLYVNSFSPTSLTFVSAASVGIPEFNIGNNGGHLVITPGTSKLVKISATHQTTTGTNTYRNDVIFQCGTFTTAAGEGDNTVTFPVAFTTILAVTCMQTNSAATKALVCSSAPTNTGFVFRTYSDAGAYVGACNVDWIAIGIL